MTPEEYERIKEAEKEHLRALKKLKKAVRDLERSKSIARSVTKMSSSSKAALETHEDMVDKLALETAQYEARLEVALESAKEQPADLSRQQDLLTADADLQKERAKSLVQQLKSEMAVPGPDAAGADETAVEPGDSDDLRSEESAEEESLPEKTIGRMRRE